jgi:hypothetical protein
MPNLKLAYHLSYSKLSKVQQDGFQELFRLVSLVRMPLAKHEAAKTRKGSTYVFNAPTRIMHDELGMAGWRVSDKSTEAIVDVLLRPLADALLLCAEGKLSAEALKAVSAEGSRDDFVRVERLLRAPIRGVLVAKSWICCGIRS